LLSGAEQGQIQTMTGGIQPAILTAFVGARIDALELFA